MKKLAVMICLLLLLPALAGAQTSATTVPAPAVPKESAVVRVNGLDFQAVAPAIWYLPPRRRPMALTLILKVTNRGDKDIQLLETFGVVLKNAAGEQLDQLDDVHYTTIEPPTRMVKKGESITLEVRVDLMPGEDAGTYSMYGPDSQGGRWQIEGLAKGQYTLSLTYEHANGDPALFWNGKAMTPALAIEIAPKPATAAPQP